MRHLGMLALLLVLIAAPVFGFGEHGGDIRFRGETWDGVVEDDFANLRARMWTSGELGEGITFDLAGLFGFEFGEGSDGENSSLYAAYVGWTNTWGTLYLGRLPASMAGNDLVVDSQRYNGGIGYFEGGAIASDAIDGVGVAIYVADLPDAMSDNQAYGVTVDVSETVGIPAHVGYADVGDWSGFYAGADVAVAEGNLALRFSSGDTATEDGSTMLARFTWPFEGFDVSAEVASVNSGSMPITGGLGDSVMVDDGTYRRFDFGWNNFTASWISWDNTAMDDQDMFRVEYNISVG